MNREQREAKIRELAEAYAERLREAWPEDETDITRIEEIAEHVGGETNRDLTEKLVREQTDQEPVQEAACPCCGGPTRYKGRYPQALVTAQGRVRVRFSRTGRGAVSRRAQRDREVPLYMQRP
jgi:hypothetical protein